MKEESSSPIAEVKSGFWKAIGGSLATGFLWILWKLLQYIKIIPSAASHWVSKLIPKQDQADAISRHLWHFGLGLLAISFVYVFWRENKYVSHMYVKRDALEAGKLKPGDLTLEEGVRKRVTNH